MKCKHCGQEIKNNWIDLGDGYEIFPEVLHKNMTFKNQKKALNKDEQIASYEQVQSARNRNLHDCFIDFWVNVPNPDKISEKNNYVARFYADSGGALLGCGGNPSVTNSSLGVFVVRKVRK